MKQRKIAVGIDYGAKHIGIARGDTLVKLASELTMVVNDENAIDKIVTIIQQEGASIVVVGLPRDKDGLETDQTVRCRAFADELRAALSSSKQKIIFAMQDESLTSVKAEEQLRSERHFDAIMLRNGRLDMRAAVLILTDYLEGYQEKDNG